MITKEYAKAYTEVLEIISHFNKKDYNKIPKEKIEYYERNKDKDYQFTINPEIDLAEQNISTEACAIIVTIFRDFFATEEEKNKIKEILDLNQKKKEQEKREKCNPDNIFSKVKKDKNINKEMCENNTNTTLIEYKETFFAKLKNFIFKILQIKKS